MDHFSYIIIVSHYLYLNNSGSQRYKGSSNVVTVITNFSPIAAANISRSPLLAALGHAGILMTRQTFEPVITRFVINIPTA